MLDPDEVTAKLRALRFNSNLRRLHQIQSDSLGLNPCLSEREVEEFEAKHGIRLPEDYRSFLLNLGNGGIGPYYGIFKLEHTYAMRAIYWKEGPELHENAEPFQFVSTPFPYNGDPEHDNELYDDLSAENWSEDGEVPVGSGDRQYPGLLVLNHTGCTVWTVLVLNGPFAGQMWSHCRDQPPHFLPTGKTFGEWYMDWLDERMSENGPS